MADPVIIGAAAPAGVVCVVIHGRGQTQSDMATGVVDRIDAPGVRFVLPKSHGLAWYDARAVDPLTDVTRAQMAAGHRQLGLLIEAELAASPGAKLVIAGFSQGACMAVEYAMRAAPWDGTLVLLTGCRVGTQADDLPLADLGGMPVYATCGDADPWIPAPAFHAMLGDLTRAGARIRTDMFPGRPHTVTATECAVMQGMLADLAAGDRPFDGNQMTGGPA